MPFHKKKKKNDKSTWFEEVRIDLDSIPSDPEALKFLSNLNRPKKGHYNNQPKNKRFR